MLEITIDNCYKCDLETINDPNKSQYFWINGRALEIETKCNWQVIFDKYKNLLTQKCRKESTPNVTFQPNEIFLRNYLFEKIIKSCKVTHLEFLKLKEKLGLCFYEAIFYEKGFVLMSEKIITRHDIENKQLKEENKKLNGDKNENENENENEKLNVNENENENENDKKNEKFIKNKIVKDSNIKELIEEPKEIKSFNWLDKNKFKGIFHKNKIGDFKYIVIKHLVNNTKDNAISEIDAKKCLNTLNIIRKFRN